MDSYFKKRYNSFKFALQGLNSAVRSEPHMRLHVLSAIGVIVAGFLFDVTKTEWCLLAGSIGLVITAEIFNTSIETLTNLVSPQHNPLAGKTKDLAAAAVLVTAITAAIVGLIIFTPYVLDLLNAQ
ncbi:diacylglycerol kinase family protein [Pontibacter sp. BT310]|uniref:Diacylglycerol kinase family protein n=1 Tax=Pontibacter populi TaxID=890055 RepID=A0ABS6XA10_9BACT|nr:MULTISPECIES: diacylglycerol kinase family protein [Pontibacter]MBJ6117642.1 diacylglycerol kinase family protein [Pontibacter sp. BT310]MBR0570068.1 diacylglycerol kinase family protein [Microvirga sp. STS03]MBW3364494.1 diacylglycerol kinase family protein [Pontibacter populi]